METQYNAELRQIEEFQENYMKRKIRVNRSIVPKESIELKQFIQHLITFCEQVKKIIPTDYYLKAFIQFVKVSKTANPYFIYEQYLSYIYPLREPIMAEDEDFLMNVDYNNYTEDKIPLSKVLSLRRIYEYKINEHNKKMIWKYMKILVILGNKVTDCLHIQLPEPLPLKYTITHKDLVQN